MAHFTKVRFHYLDVKKKRQVAAANTVIFDLPDDAAEDAIERDYVRPATEGEIAEARARMPAKKAEVEKTEAVGKKSAKKAVEKTAAGDDTQPGGAGDDTQPGGADDDLA